MIDAAKLVKNDISVEAVVEMAEALRNVTRLDDMEERFAAYMRLGIQLPATWKLQRIADDVAHEIERQRRWAGYQ